MRRIAIAVSMVSGLVACKGEPTDKPPSNQAAARPPEPRIPSGPVPVTLPTIEPGQARRVPSATAFVTIYPAGLVAYGALAPGPKPYVGKDVATGTSLRDEILGVVAPGAAPAVAAAGSGSAAPDDDAQRARQQAIDAARNAGVLGSTATMQGGAFASLTGTGDFGFAGWGLEGLITAVLEPVGVVDVIVLADAGARAELLGAALGDLEAHRTAIAVAGAGAPDGVTFRFGRTSSTAFPTSATITLSADTLSVVGSSGFDPRPISPPLPGRADRPAITKLVADLVSEPQSSSVAVIVSPDATVQQLVDVLSALAAAKIAVVSLGPETGWDLPARYGIIGHGAGTGTGYGVGGGRGGTVISSTPSVSIGQPSSVGDLDKAIIRRYIKRKLQHITYCYEKELLIDDELKGTTTVEFFIAPSGKVATAKASGFDPDVDACIAGVVKTIEFPKPTGGGGVQVRYPFTFRPHSP